MDLAEELKRMERKDTFTNGNEQDGKLDWFEPRTGIYRIKILGVGQNYTVNISGKEVEKARFEVEVMNSKTGVVKRYNWGVPKGYSQMSIWGQLLTLYKIWGDITNKQFTLIVKEIESKGGIRRDYTIVEVIEYLQNK